MVLDPQVSPEEIMSSEVELGLRKLDFLFASSCNLLNMRCNGHCPCDSAQHSS